MLTNTPIEDLFTYAQIRQAEHLFKQNIEFAIGATQLEHIPNDNLPQVAFVGRSNVGKSSLINALCNRKSLARTSKTPGRTQQLNFFNLNNQLHIVDLPGYGYAKVSKSDIAAWNKLSTKFMRQSPNLERVFILIDSRHGLKQSDIDIMSVFDEFAVSYQIVATKADKSNQKNIAEIINYNYGKHTALYGEIIVTSSVKKFGVDKLRCIIASLIN